MSKRTNYPRIDKDAYMTTDSRAVTPLFSYLSKTLGKNVFYYEPCVGDGSLVKLLSSEFECVGQSDLEKDAQTTQYETNADFFITNPPWSRDLLHPIIENLRNQLPTWLLFDADWMHTQQAIPYIKYCKTIVSVGRLKWFVGTKHDPMDNCAWYLFDKEETTCTFIPREKR